MREKACRNWSDFSAFSSGKGIQNYFLRRMVSVWSEHNSISKGMIFLEC